MGKNNTMYRCFKQMVEGYKAGAREGEAMLAQGAINWLSCEPDNPFEVGSAEHTRFDRMQQHYIDWKRNTTGSRFSKKQVVREAEELCKLKPKCPYKFNRQEDEKDKKEAQEEEVLRQKADAEREAKEIERQAALIVEQERRRQEQAEAAAKAKEERKKREAELRAEQERKNALLRKAVEDKRIEMKKLKEEADAEKEVVEKKVVLGVLPEDEHPVIEEKQEKPKRRLFGWLKKEK